MSEADADPPQAGPLASAHVGRRSRVLERILRARRARVLVAYGILDLLCVGLGMGVPIFCIVLGFGVGWFAARRTLLDNPPVAAALREALLHGALVSALTAVLMAILWGRALPMLWDPGADLASFGIPMILYEPHASFAGWLVLMILISPFLQLLSSVFAAYLTLAHAWKRRP